MPIVTNEQILAFREAAIELEQDNENLAAQVHLLQYAGTYTVIENNLDDLAEEWQKAVGLTAKQSMDRFKATAIKEVALMVCPVSGYVVRDKQARDDLIQYANLLEK